MKHSFFQRIILTLMAGFASASLIWVYRHFVEQARYELSDEGYRNSLTIKK